MTSHNRDLVSLFFGTFFIVVAAVYLLSAGGVVSFDSRWAIPAALLSFGGAGLFGALRRRTGTR